MCMIDAEIPIVCGTVLSASVTATDLAFFVFAVCVVKIIEMIADRVIWGRWAR